MFGVTLLMPTPFTNRSLKADPVELTEEAEPLAVVVATPRTRLAVTSPLRMFTLAASATLVCFAWAGDSATVLVLEVRITSARRSSPLGWGTLTLSICSMYSRSIVSKSQTSSMPALLTSTSIGPSDDSVSFTRARSDAMSPTSVGTAIAFALARSGRSLNLIRCTAVRSLSSEVMEVEDRVFMWAD